MSKAMAMYDCGHTMNFEPGSVLDQSCPQEGCGGRYHSAKYLQEDGMRAHEFLESGLSHMKDRAATYDAPQGERSMGKTVDMFRALTGVEMTEEQGWKFMCCLKLVRSEQGDFRADNFEDLAAYAGLAGEAASNAKD